jgi:hypothetical protein
MILRGNGSAKLGLASLLLLGPELEDCAAKWVAGLTGLERGLVAALRIAARCLR